MTDSDELIRENTELKTEIDILQLRRENRNLKRQIGRLKAGKSPEPPIPMYQLLLVLVTAIIFSCGVIVWLDFFFDIF